MIPILWFRNWASWGTWCNLVNTRAWTEWTLPVWCISVTCMLTRPLCRTCGVVSLAQVITGPRRRDRPNCCANLSAMKDASASESSKALVCAIKPLGPRMTTWQVNNNTLPQLPFERLLETFTTGDSLNRSSLADLGKASSTHLLVSWCNNVWCVP